MRYYKEVCCTYFPKIRIRQQMIRKEDIMKSERKKIKILKHKKLILALIILLAALAAAVYLKFYNNSPEFSTKYLMNQLEKSGELTTTKLTITGVGKYTDEGIAIINKADFRMIYKATIRAGIDITKTKININKAKKKVIVTLPDAEIFEAHVDPGSIEYLDEKLALFNTDAKEDSDRAQAMAEKDALKTFAETGFLETANTQSEDLIKGILA